jgi:hypothetical protein
MDAHLDDNSLMIVRDILCKGNACYNLRAADDVQSSFFLTPNAMERGLGYSYCQECIADMSVEAQLTEAVNMYYADKVQCDVIGCSRMTEEQLLISVCEECSANLNDDLIHELLELERARKDYHIQTQAMEDIEAADYLEAHHADIDFDD